MTSNREDGWYCPCDNCWDLWVSNEVVATVSRTALHWTGVYYGELSRRKEFVGPRNSPHDVMRQIEDYVTEPLEIRP